MHCVVVLKKLPSSNKKRKGESAQCVARANVEARKLAGSKTDLHDLRDKNTRSVMYRQSYVGTVEVQMAEFSCAELDWRAEASRVSIRLPGRTAR